MDALVAQRRQRAGEHRLGDRREGHPQLERVLRRPAAGALLLGLIEDHVEQRLARSLVGLGHDRGRDLDQERLELALVPAPEHLGDLRHLEAHPVAKQVVGLGDQLDVGVLDAVVDHLHVVAGAVVADVGAAGRAVHLGGDLLEHLLDLAVRFAVPARHDARALERALLAARHAGAEEAQAALGELAAAALRVAEVGVAAVDDHVAALHQRHQLLDHGVDRLAGLDHHDDRARRRQRSDELLRGAGALERALVAVLVHEALRLRSRAVVHGHRDAVVGDVAREVGAHGGQAGEAEVTLGGAAHINGRCAELSGSRRSSWRSSATRTIRACSRLCAAE